MHQSQKPLVWENPAVIQINKENGHALAPVYQSAKAAMAKTAPPFRLLLNGSWKFYWHKGAATFPEGLENPTLDDSAWGNIQVPGVWELQGYGRPCYYANSYPQAIGTSKKHIPQISHGLQEMGVYRRHFTLPVNFESRRVFLHFGAAKAALEVYLNGRFLGYSQGSMTPHEFDATSLLQPGENQLTA
ncbi:MAG: sugar-binding domain-containing protein [Oscillospiraceae bacterium]